jgi:hypothetical protein
MPSFQGPVRWLAFALSLPLALSAIPVGVALVLRPDGSLVGMPPSTLAGTPFDDFLAPGLLLAGAVGGSTLAAAVLAARGAPRARLVTLGAGLVTVGWIAVQVAMLGYLSGLQPMVGGLGLALVALGALARTEPAARS